MKWIKSLVERARTERAFVVDRVAPVARADALAEYARLSRPAADRANGGAPGTTSPGTTSPGNGAPGTGAPGTGAPGTGVVLELPYPSSADARRALLRGAYRRSAIALREELGYPGAALALELLAEGLRSPHPVTDDEETTVVDGRVVDDDPARADADAVAWPARSAVGRVA